MTSGGNPSLRDLISPAGPAAITDEVDAPWRAYIHCWQALLQGSSTDVRPHAIALLV